MPSYVAIVSLLLVSASAALADATLTPLALPGPLLKAPNLIDPRTPLGVSGTTCNSTITVSLPGTYVLMCNIAVGGTDGIVINASNVTLDLNGFTIYSAGAPATGSGIRIGNNLTGIAIANGHISSSTTYANGVFAGAGFHDGIGGSPSDSSITVVGVSVTGVAHDGIAVGPAGPVRDCTAHLCGSTGIRGGVVTDCSATLCGASAIVAGGVAANCHGISTTGIGIVATTALNCYGESATNDGISAVTATNCYGHSESGIGVVTNLANLCYGLSYTSYGIMAVTATSCGGWSEYDTGLYCANAFMCSAGGGGSPVLVATGTANTCWVQGSAPIAIQARIAIGCTADTGTISANSRYLMP